MFVQVRDLKKNIDSKKNILICCATYERLEKLGLNKSIYDKIVDEYFKDEINLIGDEFSKLLKLNYANHLKKSPDAKKYKGWFSRIERL